MITKSLFLYKKALELIEREKNLKCETQKIAGKPERRSVSQTSNQNYVPLQMQVHP